MEIFKTILGILLVMAFFAFFILLNFSIHLTWLFGKKSVQPINRIIISIILLLAIITIVSFIL
ncbi:MAG: hypothetical protein A3I07_00610 [Candidatus Doudnabacteria bacterium RIFCSPLOWO2_02_FULL_42_9]|uniref:Uncharacterized protein n=1 Tax=Candidatus Doudnabacteria bacterium RIFCSPHIGHO2_01_FULL_41_86 TaxID=1817821 RepID=A0A1F5N8I9_9BACT|nr:MAG: hypothetical protein A2717_04440 [Candidatus Doudnabacteria bacterium RIFCSPHIGHO2_01_FULL_41_86]OGE75861.1 MAG: hypothetical protein A3K07_04035 [Candidatus Doudnabacteria bacterium RIFCSPHIGHO2_01_43_10]OGE86235.1 MAG: hypothetical protein A3E28_03795 [Candidatus Doudnabacteria bacterium RIFCSPHIGHO2_12_FULL_42_22]OGE92223.1 MAG: hypothetical protein A2895_04145 [Candidatus Doudnabacteria bacterium RIFCSPLOWO2_01_FULL_42_60]OGE92936.1 MAG: hypothetical protein A3K08_00985 [Candidatus 